MPHAANSPRRPTDRALLAQLQEAGADTEPIIAALAMLRDGVAATNRRLEG